MTIRKGVAFLSLFIGLAVLLSGCAGSVLEAKTSAATTGESAAIPSSTSVLPSQTTTVSVESQPPATQEDYTPVAPWDTLTAPTLADFTTAQLWAEYQADPLAADAKYYGKTYLFQNVVIDEMAMLYKGMASPADAWVLSSNVYFRTDNKSRIMDLKVGDVVEITGAIMGTMRGYVLVEHCSYKIIDDTNGITRPNWIDIPG